jgi:hypothetical protein
MPAPPEASRKPPIPDGQSPTRRSLLGCRACPGSWIFRRAPSPGSRDEILDHSAPRAMWLPRLLRFFFRFSYAGQEVPRWGITLRCVVKLALRDSEDCFWFLLSLGRPGLGYSILRTCPGQGPHLVGVCLASSQDNLALGALLLAVSRGEDRPSLKEWDSGFCSGVGFDL